MSISITTTETVNPLTTNSRTIEIYTDEAIAGDQIVLRKGPEGDLPGEASGDYGPYPWEGWTITVTQNWDAYSRTNRDNLADCSQPRQTMFVEIQRFNQGTGYWEVVSTSNVFNLNFVVDIPTANIMTGDAVWDSTADKWIFMPYYTQNLKLAWPSEGKYDLSAAGVDIGSALLVFSPKSGAFAAGGYISLDITVNNSGSIQLDATNRYNHLSSTPQKPTTPRPEAVKPEILLYNRHKRLTNRFYCFTSATHVYVGNVRWITSKWPNGDGYTTRSFGNLGFKAYELAMTGLIDVYIQVTQSPYNIGTSDTNGFLEIFTSAYGQGNVNYTVQPTSTPDGTANFPTDVPITCLDLAYLWEAFRERKRMLGEITTDMPTNGWQAVAEMQQWVDWNLDKFAKNYSQNNNVWVKDTLTYTINPDLPPQPWTVSSFREFIGVDTLNGFERSVEAEITGVNDTIYVSGGTAQLGDIARNTNDGALYRFTGGSPLWTSIPYPTSLHYLPTLISIGFGYCESGDAVYPELLVPLYNAFKGMLWVHKAKTQISWTDGIEQIGNSVTPTTVWSSAETEAWNLKYQNAIPNPLVPPGKLAQVSVSNNNAYAYFCREYSKATVYASNTLTCDYILFMKPQAPTVLGIETVFNVEHEPSVFSDAKYKAYGPYNSQGVGDENSWCYMDSERIGYDDRTVQPVWPSDNSVTKCVGWSINDVQMILMYAATKCIN